MIKYIKDNPYQALADIIFVCCAFALTYGIITFCAIVFQ
jgi:hypothetical protein